MRRSSAIQVATASITSSRAFGLSSTLLAPNKPNTREQKLTEFTSTVSQYPYVSPTRVPQISLGDRIGSSLLSQKYIQRDNVRERRFSICSKCGHITLTIGFDTTPSARVGMMGRCANDLDYSHHNFLTITESDYHQLRPLDLNERLTWYAFHRN